MIHHISIDARDPLRVAKVLAEILDGKAYKFLTPGSFTVMSFDDYGTCIVVFKQGDVWTPGINTETAKVMETTSTDLVATHAAISVPTTQQQIEQIGKREGWRVLTKSKQAPPLKGGVPSTREQGDAPFSLIEFWVENRILFEFLPPDFVPQYLQIVQLKEIEQILGQPI